jgi:hypothetical protein
VEGDGGARVDLLGGLVLEKPALEVMQGGARLLRIVVVERRELELRGAAGEQLLAHRAHRLEGQPPALEGQRDGHVGVAVARERLERVELEAVEVVEAVDEDRRAAPRVPVRPQCVERAPCEQLRVHELGGVEAAAVRAVERRELVRVPAARAVTAPFAEGARHAGRVHRVSDPTDLREETRGRAHEAGLGGRFGEQVQAGASDRLLDDQLALELGGLAAAEASARGQLLEQPFEPHHASAEDRAALGELPLRVLYVGERWHHQDRVLVEAGTQAAQHLARLGGVRGTGYEVKGHTEIVATRPDRLTRAPRARPRRRARP